MKRSSSVGSKGEENGAAKKERRMCPYLDTIKRQLLDFDFEKVCSVTLSNQNVYACLICGKYFQGRGVNTPAYTHSLQSDHYVFMNLTNGSIYCLPDNYLVVDSSLNDIKYNLYPSFTPEELSKLDSNTTLSKDIFGVSYLPGFVGLNNLRNTDYVNVVIQSLIHVKPLRNFFLKLDNYKKSKSSIVHAFGELMCKLWSTNKFKGSVSPHALLHAISVASKKRFQIGTQAECIDFTSWFLNQLHVGLGGTKEPNSSIIHECFQGEVEVTSFKPESDSDEGAKTMRVKTLMLSLELPPAPLFKDSHDGKSIIPQVPLYEVLEKFNGEKTTDMLIKGKLQRKKYIITKLPKYMLINLKRFTKNNFYVEKNSTIVTFPINNLVMKQFLKSDNDPGFNEEALNAMSVKELKKISATHSVDVSSVVEKREIVSKILHRNNTSTKYKLLANVVHDSPPDTQQKDLKKNALTGGCYRCQVQNKATEQWYEIQDLHVRETLPQLIGLSESYFMLYERS